MANTKDDIMQRLMSNIDNKYDKTVGSFMYDTQKPTAIESERIYSRIEKISNRAFVKTATGADLDEKLGEVGLTRKVATYATGTVTITGTTGTNVSAGIKVMSDKLLFTISSAGTVGQTGTVDVTAICDTVGSCGNVPASSISKFATSITGLTTVTNAAAFTGGYDEETDEEARERYEANAKKPPTSGNKYHYEAWAMEVSGVGSAKCVPLWDNNASHTPGQVPGSVTVLIINKNREVASSDLITAVSNHIDAEKPIGPTVTVASASPLSVNVSVEVTLQSGYALSQITEKIRSAITAHLKDIAFEQEYVSYAHIGKTILQIDGISDYENLQLNNGTQNIDVTAGQVPVLGVLTVE